MELDKYSRSYKWLKLTPDSSIFQAFLKFYFSFLSWKGKFWRIAVKWVLEMRFGWFLVQMKDLFLELNFLFSFWSVGSCKVEKIIDKWVSRFAFTVLYPHVIWIWTYIAVWLWIRLTETISLHCNHAIWWHNCNSCCCEIIVNHIGQQNYRTQGQSWWSQMFCGQQMNTPSRS